VPRTVAELPEAAWRAFTFTTTDRPITPAWLANAADLTKALVFLTDWRAEGRAVPLAVPLAVTPPPGPPKAPWIAGEIGLSGPGHIKAGLLRQPHGELDHAQNEHERPP
jgi:hypothetical protein